MPLRIHFARHGESQANIIREISNRGLVHGLTRKGRLQAQALAERMRGRPIRVIYSSPLLRAIETSVLVAENLGLDYAIVDGLREFDCGIMEGRSDTAAWKGWKDVVHAWLVERRWDEKIEGGESFNDIRARFEPLLAKLTSHHEQPAGEVLCISHGGIYILMLPLVLKNVDAGRLFNSGFNNTDFLTAELREDGLYCTEWNGHPVDLT